jgi:hypothetical protein
MNTIKVVSIWFLVVLLASGCGSSPTLTATALPTEANPLPTVKAAPVEPTQTPSPEFTATPTNTPAPVVLDGTVNAATLNMRTGPSILHDILNQYQKDDPIKVIGVAPGKEWLKVIAKDGKTGWMYVNHVDLKGDVSSLPTMQINESLAVIGKVVDASGNGIPGIQIGLSRIGGTQAVRVEGITLTDGTVHIYAPVEYQGTWLATVMGAACTSPIVDTNCRFAGKFTPAEGISVKLPQDTEILFTYK